MAEVLERELRELGRTLELPPTPELAAVVAERLRTEAPGPAPARLPWRPLALAFAVLLLAFGAAMAVPQARSAILDFFGFGGVEIRRVETLPPTPATAGLDLGRRVTLDGARELVSFEIRIPAELGDPDEVYVRRTQGQRLAVSLVYRAEGAPLLILTELRGLGTPFAQKALGPGTRLVEVVVDGRIGAWVTGRPHAFVIRDPSGVIYEERARLVGNTLLWDRNGVAHRLEGAPSRARALEIADSLE